MKKRYPQMDALRALAALAVVMIHVSAGSTGLVSVACNQLARFAVPMFLLLSGFGHGAQEAAPGRWWENCRRRLVRVLPAYFIWSVLYLAVDAVFGKPHARPVRDLLIGNAYMHLYYVFVLLQFVLLSVWLTEAVRRKPGVTLAAAAAVSLLAQAMLCAHAVGKIVLPAVAVPYVCWFLPWTVFYVAGIWMRQHEVWQKLPLVLTAPLWAVSAALVLLTAKAFPALRASSLRPDLVLYVFTTCLLLWGLCSRLPALPRPIRFISRHSFGLYLAHPLVMRLWSEWTVRQTPVIYLKLWQWWGMALAGGLVIAYVLSLLPFGTWLGGTARNQERITEVRNGEKEN